VLASTGWSMLKQKDEDDTKAGVHRNVDTNDLFQKAFYPLTLPLTVGPGSISVAITLGANEPHRQHSLIFSMLGAVIGAVLIGRQRLSLLRVFRSAGPGIGGHFNERDHAAVFIFAGLHRNPDRLEWAVGDAESLPVTGHPG